MLLPINWLQYSHSWSLKNELVGAKVWLIQVESTQKYLATRWAFKAAENAYLALVFEHGNVSEMHEVSRIKDNKAFLYRSSCKCLW